MSVGGSTPFIGKEGRDEHEKRAPGGDRLVEATPAASGNCPRAALQGRLAARRGARVDGQQGWLGWRREGAFDAWGSKGGSGQSAAGQNRRQWRRPCFYQQREEEDADKGGFAIFQTSRGQIVK